MTPSKSSAYLLLLVGYTYLMSFPYRPSFILYFCLQQTLQRAGLSQLEPGFFCLSGWLLLNTVHFTRKEQGYSPFTIRNSKGLPGSCVLLFIHATPSRHRQTSGISPFHSRFLCIGFRYSENVAICIFDYYGAVPCFRGVPFPLWPI